jgi:hypothetical protein
MKKLTISATLLLGIGFANAQQKADSLQKRAALEIKEKFPQARLLNIEYGQSLSRDFNSDLLEQAYNEGKIKSQNAIKVAANVPLYRTRKWSLTASANYQYNQFEFENVQNSTTKIFEQNGKEDFHNLSGALSSTYFSSLFKIPVIYNASVIVDGNDKNAERVKGFLGATLIIKRTERTTMTVGAIAFIDPTSQIPFFPTFSVNHKFKNSPWEVDFILPQRLLLRRFVGENGRFSIGSTFGSTGFYVNVDSPNFADVYQYSQLELKSGVMYEHRINDFLVGTVQGGFQNFISNRLTEKGEYNKDFIYKNKQNGTGYFNVGLSRDPFVKRKK